MLSLPQRGRKDKRDSFTELSRPFQRGGIFADVRRRDGTWKPYLSSTSKPLVQDWVMKQFCNEAIASQYTKQI